MVFYLFLLLQKLHATIVYLFTDIYLFLRFKML